MSIVSIYVRYIRTHPHVSHLSFPDFNETSPMCSLRSISSLPKIHTAARKASADYWATASAPAIFCRAVRRASHSIELKNRSKQFERAFNHSKFQTLLFSSQATKMCLKLIRSIYNFEKWFVRDGVLASRPRSSIVIKKKHWAAHLTKTTYENLR